MSHTSTPWEAYRPSNSAQDKIVNSDGTVVAAKVDEEDAAHIVKCVNAHDELIEALAGLRDMILDSREYRNPDKATRMRNADAILAKIA